jgi:hypothetical protein
MREGRRCGARSSLDGLAQRPKHASRREKAVHEYDNVAALGVRHDRRDIAAKERRLANESKGFACSGEKPRRS